MTKNTHLEHLEDDILNNGSQGGKDAIAFLRSLGKMLSNGGDSTIRITTKWDGAPAVICGMDPELKQFFVGTKSVFAKTAPKICYGHNDIDKFYPDGELNQKLKKAYDHLSKLGITDVIQGDLLYTETPTIEVINGERCYKFRPNTITYAIPVNSNLGKIVAASSLGVVFHTKYVGSTIPEMHATFGEIDTRSFKQVSSTWVTSANFSDASGSATFTAAENRAFTSLVNQTEGSLKQASRFLDAMKGTDKYALNVVLKQFFNTYVKEAKRLPSTNEVVNSFIQYYTMKLDKEIDSKKTAAAKQKWEGVKQQGLSFIKANARGFYMSVAAYKNLQKAKDLVVKQLQKVKDIGTFLQKEHGYEVTAPEGFVAIKNGRALKLVDRLEFSVANFTLEKNWIKGGQTINAN
jgi:hypothetical protein